MKAFNSITDIFVASEKSSFFSCDNLHRLAGFENIYTAELNENNVLTVYLFQVY